MNAPAILFLLIVNVGVYLAQTQFGDDLIFTFALWPFGPLFQPWQPITYAFLHGSSLHLFFNMFGLLMFGRDLERLWGPARFIRYYIVAVLGAAVTQQIVAQQIGEMVPTLGASGGVFGLLFAYAWLFPRRRVILLIPPIPMPVWLFAVLYTALELFLGVTQYSDGVAHFAHLGGMVGGALYLILSRPSRPTPPLQ